jgi:peroxiredoxin
MKTRFTLALLTALTLTLAPAWSADPEPDPEAQLAELVGKVRAKLQGGEVTEAALADELKEFDALLEQHREKKKDDVAQILLMKAMLYVQVLEDSEKGVKFLEQLAADFPDSSQAAMAQSLIKASRMQAQLAVGKTFPDFDVKDLDGKPFSVAHSKAKVVLIDFWATWCPPCIQELPNLLSAYEKYHAQGFEILGVSLDSDRDQLVSFLEKHKMTWPQHFDGGRWQTKVAQDYGINAIPATFLVDGKGVILAKDLRGEALSQAVAKALAAD